MFSSEGYYLFETYTLYIRQIYFGKNLAVFEIGISCR